MSLNASTQWVQCPRGATAAGQRTADAAAAAAARAMACDAGGAAAAAVLLLARCAQTAQQDSSGYQQQTCPRSLTQALTAMQLAAAAAVCGCQHCCCWPCDMDAAGAPA